MTFTNEKKTFLSKKDKSKKGSIDEKIKQLEDTDKRGLVWLRLEAPILHIAGEDLPQAESLLILARKRYKKSYLLSFSNKCIVEIRGSEFLEIPFYLDGKELFAGEKSWLVELVNGKLLQMWKGLELFSWDFSRSRVGNREKSYL